MIETLLPLRDRPFRPTTDPHCYVPCANSEVARQRLLQCIERREGIGLLTGPVGTGKTLLLSVFVQEFSDELAIAHLRSSALRTRRAFLQHVLYELGLPHRDKDEGELRLTLLDFLESRDRPREGVLLVIDEAQALPLRLLEEVRMATNIGSDDRAPVQAVLAGSPQLEERLANPKLVALEQRIAARCYLAPLDLEETQRYLSAQLENCGGQLQTFFTDQAVQTVWQHSEGVCRLINQLCDQALLLAAASGVLPLSDRAVTEAWSDLQQLPLAPSGPDDGADEPSIIEFGSLHDDASEQPSPEPRPVEQIDEIQRQLADVDQPEQPPASGPSANEPPTHREREQLGVFAEDAHEPAHPHLLNTETEVELRLDEPFGRGFEDEEPVVDPFSRGAVRERYQYNPAGDPLDVPQPCAQLEAMPLIVNAHESAAGDAVLPLKPIADDGPSQQPDERPEIALLAGQGDGPDLVRASDDPAPRSRRDAPRQYRRLFSKVRHGP